MRYAIVVTRRGWIEIDGELTEDKARDALDALDELSWLDIDAEVLVDGEPALTFIVDR